MPLLSPVCWSLKIFPGISIRTLRNKLNEYGVKGKDSDAGGGRMTYCFCAPSHSVHNCGWPPGLARA